jgi:hypothetical protein
MLDLLHLTEPMPGVVLRSVEALCLAWNLASIKGRLSMLPPPTFVLLQFE